MLKDGEMWNERATGRKRESACEEENEDEREREHAKERLRESERGCVRAKHSVVLRNR